MTTPATNTLPSFLTLGGAHVVVQPPRYEGGGFRWECLGCDESLTHTYKKHACDGANAHAGRCRSMPRPDGA
ncbi:hypothetical protein GCM10023085_45000 [Actinomadura viridis]|uniref:Uncharacterized protein n=1 Tax=Actinomadura viridis TaxID=58110 RepID=A0A931DKQ7_9ACTN|nr:hypothetical protein [Actinomadura viridis]MBG6089862.1 hypothetical protein [Actinomadura viridis]